MFPWRAASKQLLWTQINFQILKSGKTWACFKLLREKEENDIIKFVLRSDDKMWGFNGYHKETISRRDNITKVEYHRYLYTGVRMKVITVRMKVITLQCPRVAKQCADHGHGSGAHNCASTIIYFLPVYFLGPYSSIWLAKCFYDKRKYGLHM